VCLRSSWRQAVVPVSRISCCNATARVPRRSRFVEGDGYLIGCATHIDSAQTVPARVSSYLPPRRIDYQHGSGKNAATGIVHRVGLSPNISLLPTSRATPDSWDETRAVPWRASVGSASSSSHQFASRSRCAQRANDQQTQKSRPLCDLRLCLTLRNFADQCMFRS
jgi:hypothetical protein